MASLDNTRISKHLGKTSEYKSQYDPTLLVREPRQANRTHLQIFNDDLPFFGTDTWNAYEISALTDSGVPVTGIAKIVYPCNNPYIVESKSLKLYFNSFNMTKLGSTAKVVLSVIEKTATEDLSKLLETNVKVKIYSTDDIKNDDVVPNLEWWFTNPNDGNIKEYITLENIVDVQSLNITAYTETPKLLKCTSLSDTESAEVRFHSSLLKSNCRVTSQPDFGDIFIYIKYDNRNRVVTAESLLEYIISFRDECHFHEEICETIYTRLWDFISPEQLSVKCLYTRRGGIDICPERVSHPELAHYALKDERLSHSKTPRQ